MPIPPCRPTTLLQDLGDGLGNRPILASVAHEDVSHANQGLYSCRAAGWPGAGNFDIAVQPSIEKSGNRRLATCTRIQDHETVLPAESACDGGGPAVVSGLVHGLMRLGILSARRRAAPMPLMATATERQRYRR
jgi:hypothetical protein